MSLKFTLKNLAHQFSCDKCSEGFETALHLKYHKFRVHNRWRPFVCKECRKSFRRISELQQHRRRHKRRDHSFICSVCDEKFISRSLLNTHQGVHVHYEGDHECGYCSASFLHLAEARLHVLIVHGDASILPAKRPMRNTVSHEEVFSVKEGDGLKIKFKRKWSTDEDQTGGDDLNPGSHNSDSGKGNSDMDEDDYRNGHLLRTPTFIPRLPDQQQRTTSQKTICSGLLMKPKLEVGQTQWGGSKIQPTLTSKDFLTKTKFPTGPALTGNKWAANTLTSPQHQGTAATVSPSNSLTGSLDGSKGFNAQSNSPLAASSGLQNSPLGTSPLLTQSKLTSTGFQATNGLFNGSLVKHPVFPTSGLMPAPKFGASSMPSFGSSAAPLFGALSAASSIGASSRGAFGLSKPVFTTTSASGFGMSAFGASKPTFINTLSSFPAVPAIPPVTNGEISKQAVFGSKEKVRKMLAIKEEVETKPNAFEQYAGDSAIESNPFALAMRKAKNPTPRRYDDSDLLTDSSSYESGEEEEESQDSGVSESSENQEISDIEDVNAPLPHLEGISAPQVPVSSTVVSATEAPLQWTMPLLPSSTLPTNILPLHTSVSTLPSPPKLLNSFPSPTKHDIMPSVSPKKNRTPVRTPEHPPSATPVRSRKTPEHGKTPNHVITSPPYNKLDNSIPEELETVSIPEVPSPKLGSPPASVINDVAHMNGDIGVKSSNEVSGNIDLEEPSMSISIPKKLLEQATGISPKGRKKRRASGKGRRSASRTPSHPPMDLNDYPVPATPVYKPPEPPIKKPETRAPTKQEMMERMKKKMAEAAPKKKVKIGPKSYHRRVNGRVFSESELEEDSPRLFQRSEFKPELCARTDTTAQLESTFKSNQLYLCYLRRRALDLIITLFPDARVGGNFCTETNDVEGLLDYIILSLENKDSSKRCINSLPSKRKSLSVNIGKSTKYTVRSLQTKVCKLIKLVLPSLSFDMLSEKGIDTLPKLIHKVITENNC